MFHAGRWLRLLTLMWDSVAMSTVIISNPIAYFNRYFTRLNSTNFTKTSSSAAKTCYEVFYDDDLDYEEILFPDDSLFYAGSSMSTIKDITTIPMEGIVMPHGNYGSPAKFAIECLGWVERYYQQIASNQDLTVQQLLKKVSSLQPVPLDMLKTSYPESFWSHCEEAMKFPNMNDPIILDQQFNHNGVVNAIVLFMCQNEQNEFESAIMLKVKKAKEPAKLAKGKRPIEDDYDCTSDAVKSFLADFNSYDDNYKIGYFHAMCSQGRVVSKSYPVETLDSILNFGNPSLPVFEGIVMVLSRIVEVCDRQQTVVKKSKCLSSIISHVSKKVRQPNGFSIDLVRALTKAVTILGPSDNLPLSTLRSALSSIQSWPDNVFTVDNGKFVRVLLTKYFAATENNLQTFIKEPLIQENNINWLNVYLRHIITTQNNESILELLSYIEKSISNGNGGDEFFKYYGSILNVFALELLTIYCDFDSTSDAKEIAIAAATALWRFSAIITDSVQKDLQSTVIVCKIHCNHIDVVLFICRAIYYLIYGYSEYLKQFIDYGGVSIVVEAMTRFADNGDIVKYLSRVLNDVVLSTRPDAYKSSDVLVTLGYSLETADNELKIKQILTSINTWGIVTKNNVFPPIWYLGIVGALLRFSTDSDIVTLLVKLLNNMNQKVDWDLFADCGGRNALMTIKSSRLLFSVNVDHLLNQLPHDQIMELVEGWCLDNNKAKLIINALHENQQNTKIISSICRKLSISLSTMKQQTPNELFNALSINSKDIAIVVITSLITSCQSGPLSESIVDCLQIIFQCLQLSSSPAMADAFSQEGLCECLSDVMGLEESKNNLDIVSNIAGIICFSSPSGVDVGLNAVDIATLGLRNMCQNVVAGMETSYSNGNNQIFVQCCKIAIRLCESIDNSLRFLELGGLDKLNGLLIDLESSEMESLMKQLQSRLLTSQSRRLKPIKNSSSSTNMLPSPVAGNSKSGKN